MSSSNMKNFMKKFTVSKPTDMPDIPEEKLGPDGRPLSMVSHAGKGHIKRESVTSTVSELSTATTHVPSGLGIKDLEEKGAREPDLISIPEDVQTATPFGPNHEYKAVPSIIEYSTSRGRSRVSIREATSEEAKQSAGSQMPIISDIPELSHLNDATGVPPAGAVPRIAPPPNFEPVQSTDTTSHQARHSHPALSSHPTRHPRTSHADSMRTSTTSIRTSTTSDPRTSIATTEDDAISDRGSLASTLNVPGSPPQHLGPSPEYQKYEFPEKAPSSDGSWPLPHHHSIRSRGHNSMDTSRSGVSPSLPDSFDANQSRFSWHVSKTEKASNWFTRWFIEWWAMEILSWCFSAVCMMIIIIMLWKVDNKELPEWKLGISINAFISVFSGFAKSALLLPTAEALGQLKWSWFTRGKEKRMMDFEVIDSASRGPWGSLLMLGKTKGITLASVGAAIILLSLPLDLFFQQIVAYPAGFRVDPFSNATLARSIDYDATEDKQWRGGEWGFFEDRQMITVLYPYWTTEGVIPQVPFNCPTGNCTYDPFWTNAIDFQCTAMPSDMLEFGCREASGEWKTSVATGIDENPTINACGWYLDVPDNGMQLMSGYEVLENGTIGETLATRFFALSDVVTNQLYFDGSVNFKNVSNPIVDFILVSTPDSFDGAKANNTPVMQECEVHWVVKQLQAEVKNNILYEENLQTRQFPNEWATPWNPDDAGWYQPYFDLTLEDPFSFTGNTSHFHVDNTTARKVWQAWAQIAPSFYVLANESAPYRNMFKIVTLNGRPGAPQLAEVLDPILPWDTPNNVTAHMAGAVRAMNSVLRQNTLSRTHREDVTLGQSFKYVVYVDVRWQWITLPAALLIFALIFLLATIYRSTKDREQIGVWKTSALAILFNGLGDDVQGFVGAGNKKQGYVRRKARDIKVQLDDD